MFARRAFGSVARVVGAASAAVAAGSLAPTVKTAAPDAHQIVSDARERISQVTNKVKHAFVAEHAPPAPIPESEWKSVKEGVPKGEEGPRHSVDTKLPRIPGE
jgi:hypothetical protein